MNSCSPYDAVLSIHMNIVSKLTIMLFSCSCLGSVSIQLSFRHTIEFRVSKVGKLLNASKAISFS